MGLLPDFTPPPRRVMRRGVKAKWGGGCIRRPLPLPGNPPPIPFVGTIVYAARAAGFRSSENFL